MDLVIRNIEPSLVARVKHVAAARRCSVCEALVFLVHRGLAGTETGHAAGAVELQAIDARVLEEARIALEKVPDDPGFALIGRVRPSPPAAAAPGVIQMTAAALMPGYAAAAGRSAMGAQRAPN
jgi:hypothetical protein